MSALKLIERLEMHYQFECEAGPLKNCMEWVDLKAALETVADGLKKTKEEFQAAGKPSRYVGNIYVDDALSALSGE